MAVLSVLYAFVHVGTFQARDRLINTCVLHLEDVLSVRDPASHRSLTTCFIHII